MTHFILTIIDDRSDCRTEPYKTRETAERAMDVLLGYGWTVGIEEVAGTAPSGAI